MTCRRPLRCRNRLSAAVRRNPMKIRNLFANAARLAAALIFLLVATLAMAQDYTGVDDGTTTFSSRSPVPATIVNVDLSSWTLSTNQNFIKEGKEGMSPKQLKTMLAGETASFEHTVRAAANMINLHGDKNTAAINTNVKAVGQKADRILDSVNGGNAANAKNFQKTGTRMDKQSHDFKFGFYMLLCFGAAGFIVLCYFLGRLGRQIQRNCVN